MSDTPPKRRRGAQPGNTNAIQHGRYARHHNPLDLDRIRRDLQVEYQADLQHLGEHMQLASHLLDRVNNIPEACRLLSALVEAACCLNRLLRTRALFYDNDPQFLYDLNQSFPRNGDCAS